MQEIEKLREIDRLYKAQKVYSDEARLSEENYIKQKHPKPEKKPIELPPSKKRTTVQLTLFPVFLVLCVAILILTVSTYVTNAKYDKLSSDPGEEYVAWINNFPNVTSIDELKETWKPVEEAWAKKGIVADWSFVESAIEGYNVNSADSLDSCIKRALSTKWQENNITAGAGVPFVIAFAILAFIFGRNGKDSLADYRKKMDYFQKVTAIKNKENQEYNETTYAPLLESWEKSLVVYRSEYNIAVTLAKENLERIKQELKQYESFLPASKHSYAGKYADLLSSGQASSLASAISIQNDARLKERQQYEASQKAADAKRQASLDFEKRQKEASLRCRKCIHNANCPLSIKHGFYNRGDVCPNYIPQS